MERSIVREKLNPMIVRSLAYGVSPFDMESVLQQLEKNAHETEKALLENWNEEWTKKANRYSTYGKIAKEQRNLQSASEFYQMTANCYYACYLAESEQIARKREVYKKLERYYQAALSCGGNRFEKVFLPLKDNKGMPGYLHLPENGNVTQPYSCVIFFGGMGSCKEEAEVLARPLVKRGVAVLTLDQPGTGSTLFDFDIKTGADTLELAFEVTMEYVRKHVLLDETKLGTYGFSMGGSYAHRMAAKYEEIKSCVTVVPVFLTMEEENHTSPLKKDSIWANYQRERGSIEAFLEGMKVLEEGSIAGDYLTVYSEYEEAAYAEHRAALLESVAGTVDKIVIPDVPVHATTEAGTMGMPVTEQIKWVKIKVADWMVAHLKKEAKVLQS